MMNRRFRLLITAAPIGLLLCTDGQAGTTLDATADCAAGSAIYSEVPLHTGVANERVVAVQPIGSLKFPTGYEGGQYADCLQREGVTRDVNKDPYFARLEECRARARHEVSVTEEGASPASIGTTSSAAVDACMRGAPPPVQPASSQSGDNRIQVDVDSP